MKKIASLIVIILTFFINEVYALNKSVIDVTKITMSEAIDYLDKGVITSEELVKLYLDRINAYNSDYNAIITVNPNIIEEAKESDELRKNNKKRGILEGIPVIVKDNIDVKGMPTTAGAKALIDNYPLEDADVVKKLKSEGALIIAKANMSEFAFSAKDSYSSFGYVSNAYRLGYSSYGSSGGSAVSVALSFGSVALGTDTNSSVRIPAAAAGLVGIRPTTGKISSKGVINYDINRDTVGIISKSITDSKIIWGIISDEKSDYVIDNDKTIIVGIPKNLYEGNGKEGYGVLNAPFLPIKEMFDNEINKMSQKNVEIVYLDDIYTNTFSKYNNLSVAGYTMCKAFNEYIKGTTGSIRSFGDLVKSKEKVFGLSGYYKSCNYSNKNYNNTIKYMNLAKEYMNNIYNKYNLDYVIYPTTKNEIYSKGNNYMLKNVSGTMSSTIGYPSITIPLGYYDNFPYGLEIMGKPNEEQSLYSFAEIIEKDNYLVNYQESSAAKLYDVPQDVESLVKFYMINSNEDNAWLKDVKKYFNKYNESEYEKKISSELLESFISLQKEKNVMIKKVSVVKLINEYFSILFMILLITFIFLFSMLLTFKIFKNLIRKY